jgi:hypothetical protein
MPRPRGLDDLFYCFQALAAWLRRSLRGGSASLTEAKELRKLGGYRTNTG